MNLVILSTLPIFASSWASASITQRDSRNEDRDGRSYCYLFLVGAAEVRHTSFDLRSNWAKVHLFLTAGSGGVQHIYEEGFPDANLPMLGSSTDHLVGLVLHP